MIATLCFSKLLRKIKPSCSREEKTDGKQRFGIYVLGVGLNIEAREGFLSGKWRRSYLTY